MLMHIHTYVGSNKPTIKQIMKYEEKIAPHWNNLGIQLLEEKYVHKLKIIKENNRGDIEKCCTEMLDYWLDVDIKASWDKLIDALECIGQNTLAERIKEDVFKGSCICYVQTYYVRICNCNNLSCSVRLAIKCYILLVA